MPRPRFLRADPAIQTAILDTALDELGTEGYDGASLNRILLAAGLSKGAFYYYFDDKADLAAAVLERELARWNVVQDLDLGTTPDTFWAALEHYARCGLDLLRAAPKSRDVIVRLGAAAMRDPALRERLAPHMAQGQARMTTLWQRGIEIGAVRKDLPAATLITLAQGAKSTLGAAMLPTDRAATDAELETFTHVYIDLIRRMTQETS